MSVQWDTGFARPSRAAQRGAAAVLVAVSLTALATTMVLVADIGRLYYGQRQLEQAATLSSLAGAQVASGCLNGGVPGGSSATAAAVTSSLVANLGSDGGRVLTGANGAPAVQLGTLVESGGRRVFTPLDEHDPRVDAVRVNLSTPMPATLSNLIPGVPGTLTASATGVQSATASFSIGTTLASLDTTQSQLLNGIVGGLLGGKVSLSVAGYNGLANAHVSLAGLAAAAGVKDVSDLLNVETSLPGALQLVGDALAASGDSVSAAAAGTILGLAGIADGSRSVRLGDVLDITGLTDATLSQVSLVDAQTLLIALGEAARADPSNPNAVVPIALPVSVAVPGVSNLKAFLVVGAPPKIAMGRAGEATASTAEITLRLRMQVTGLSTLTGLLGPLLSVGPINLGTDVAIAIGTSSLDRVVCPGINVATPTAHLSAVPQVASVRLGTFTGSPDTGPALAESSTPLLTISSLLLGSTSIKLAAPVAVDAGSATETALAPYTEYVVAPGTLPRAGQFDAVTEIPSNPQTVGSSDLLGSSFSSLLGSLRGNLTVDSSNPLIKSLGGVLTSLLDAVISNLSPVLTGAGGVLDSVIHPLLASLGLQVGSATVQVNGVQTAPAINGSFDLPST